MNRIVPGSAIPDSPSPAAALPALQRAAGRASAVLGLGGGETRLRHLHQSGAAKLFLPRVHGDRPELVFLNTAGGLTDGDRLAYGVELEAGACAVAGTQTAERAYGARAAGGVARLEVALSLGAGAVLDWLPQETILYEDAALDRLTRVEMAAGARLVLCEMVVFGRAAMGERVGRLRFRDRREVWSGGRPLWIDPLAVGTAALAAPDRPRPALIGGARAIATIALIGQAAEDAAESLRAARAGIAGDGVEMAVSGWDGRCLLRMRAADALPLKRAVARALGILRGGRPLPRVWQI